MFYSPPLSFTFGIINASAAEFMMARALFSLIVILLVMMLSTSAPAGNFFSSSDDSTAVEGASHVENDSASGMPWQSSSRDASTNGDFLPVDQAFTYRAWREGNTIKVGFASADDYYLYRHRFNIQSDRDDVRLSEPDVPRGEAIHDEFLGDVEVFHHPLIVTVTLETPLPDDAPIPLRVDFQGCAEAGLCYSPETRHIQAAVGNTPERFANALMPGDPPPDSNEERSDEAPNGTALTALPGQSSLPLMMGLFLLAGLGLAFTPCVLPMLPIVTTLVVGQNANRRRALKLSSAYVAGMSLTYAALGTLMGLFGAGLNLQARLQSPWVLVPFAFLFLVFALWLLDVWQFSPGTRFQQRINGWQDQLRRAGLPGAMLAGALSTLIVSPCISAPLAGVLVYLSAGSDPLTGMLALLVLGLGMGLPLILVATLGAGWLPRRGPWMEGVRQLFAVALAGVALWLLERLLPDTLSLALWGGLAVLTGMGMGALSHVVNTLWGRLRQALALMITLWGALCLTGAAMGHDDPWAPLAGHNMTSTDSRHATLDLTTVTTREALDRRIDHADRPVMIDVYADWCISCRRFERDVLENPDIRTRLQGLDLIRLDVTDNDSEARALLKRYSLFGPPALLFFSNGKEMRSLRTQGEISREQMSNLLGKVAENT
ncbi:thiol:disulfide interchange protein DsbD [Kushneria avicenniae]|uniref:Thiol:disulfide interchange protein DsbD n=1 Tax=Kushneria avicenniae TaxID=402385 RepID=A0A1I1G1E3_9GAMM|nr:protein-disulfide reductase DsbD [Kushneria avicenniae]SFC05341.1 thiol:disulfide interchange protein DsbD [Kushneria avicenniae]